MRLVTVHMSTYCDCGHRAQFGIFFPCGTSLLETAPSNTRSRVCLLATLDFDPSTNSSSSEKNFVTLLDLQGSCFLTRQASFSLPLSSLDMKSTVITFIHFFRSFSDKEDLLRALVRSWSFYNKNNRHAYLTVGVYKS